jgi:hypothetical protein
MFNPTGMTAGQIGGNVQQALVSLRSAASQAGNICQWVVAQAHADLVAAGFSDTDATMLQAVCGNIVTLLAGANGGPPAPQLNYIADALDVIGPNG